MKGFLLIFSAICAASVADPLTEIEGIKGIIEKVESDSNGNIFVVSKISTSSYLHKVNPSKKLLNTMNLPNYFVGDMLVTKSGKVYINYLNSDLSYTYAIVRSDLSNMDTIGRSENSLFFLDSSDNLVFSKDHSVHLLKESSAESVPIKNLEDMAYTIFKNPKVDKDGNVYFPVIRIDASDETNKIAFITAKSLQQGTPQAELIEVVEHPKQIIHGLIVDELNNWWILLWDLATDAGVVRKRTGGLLQTIITVENEPYIEGILAKDKIFIISAPKDIPTIDPTGNIFAITLDGTTVDVAHHLNLTGINLQNTKGVSDSKGNVYFQTSEPEFVEQDCSIFTVAQIESSPPSSSSSVAVHPVPANLEFIVPIVLPRSNVSVNFLEIDFDDNVWILPHDENEKPRQIHRLKKGSVTAEIPLEYASDMGQPSSKIFVNRLQKEIYLAYHDGLYLFKPTN